MGYKKEVKEKCLGSSDKEVCGLICFDNNYDLKVIELKNAHKNKSKHFQVDPSDYIKCVTSYDVLMCFHSHPSGTATPSKHDKQTSEEMALPFLIYSVEKDNFYLYIPNSFKPKSLISRVYVEDLYQCNNLVEDYLLMNNKQRERSLIKNYCVARDNKFLLRLMNKNFDKVEKIEDVKDEDVFLFKISNQAFYHLGIYVGGGEFLHQPENALSRSEILDHKWQNRLCNIYRPKG